MMSYLWILLLGSLLAAGANAQDDVADTEEAAASGTPAPEANAEPEVNGEPETDETAEEIPLPGSEAEPEPEPATDAHPAAEDEEPEVAAGGDAEPTPAADAEEEAETPAAAAADTEEEAAAPTPEPAVVPEVADPGAEQPTAEGEDATTSETDDATLAPVADDEATDPALADTTEAPTDPGVDTGPADPVVPLDKEVEQVEDHIPAVKEELEQPEANPDLGFNLEDALLEDKPSQDKPKSRSAEQPGQAAGATGEADKPEAQVSNSGSVAGILCGLAVALVGAAAGYFTYQKKKLCFKNRQEADPEAARKADAAEAQADPQVLSTLLNSS